MEAVIARLSVKSHEGVTEGKSINFIFDSGYEVIIGAGE